VSVTYSSALRIDRLIRLFRFDEPTNRSLRLHFAYRSLSYENNGLLADIARLNSYSI